jgi:hypothetical protein
MKTLLAIAALSLSSIAAAASRGPLPARDAPTRNTIREAAGKKLGGKDLFGGSVVKYDMAGGKADVFAPVWSGKMDAKGYAIAPLTRVATVHFSHQDVTKVTPTVPLN